MSTISAQVPAVLPYSKLPAIKVASKNIAISTLIGVMCAGGGVDRGGVGGAFGASDAACSNLDLYGCERSGACGRGGGGCRFLVRAVIVAASCTVAMAMTPAILPVVNIASVLMVMAAMGFIVQEEEKPVVGAAVLAIAVFAIFRMCAAGDSDGVAGFGSVGTFPGVSGRGNDGAEAVGGDNVWRN